MASSLALRRLAGGMLHPRGVTLSAATRPSFITTSSNVALHSRRHYTAYPFTVVRGVGKIVGQIYDIKFTDSQFMVYEKPCGEAGTLGEMKEDWEAIHLTADLPGLSKDDVIVFIHQNQLHVTAKEGLIKKVLERRMKKNNNDKEEENTSKPDEKLTSTSYIGDLALTPKSYKANEVKAEMNNGQLHITVPKLKIEEREDLINIPVV